MLSPCGKHRVSGMRGSDGRRDSVWSCSQRARREGPPSRCAECVERCSVILIGLGVDRVRHASGRHSPALRCSRVRSTGLVEQCVVATGAESLLDVDSVDLQPSIRFWRGSAPHVKRRKS